MPNLLFFEQVIFSFLTGNADKHLKNFSLVKLPHIGYSLSPAYDMVSSRLMIKDDKEELALNLNGKKRKLNKYDFIEAMKRFDIDTPVVENIFRKFQTSYVKWDEFIKISFIPDNMKIDYIELIKERMYRLNLI